MTRDVCYVDTGTRSYLLQSQSAVRNKSELLKKLPQNQNASTSQWKPVQK